MRSTVTKIALSTVFGVTLGLGLGSVTPAPPTKADQLQNPPNPNNCEVFDCCGAGTPLCVPSGSSASVFKFGAGVPKWKSGTGGPVWSFGCTVAYYGTINCSGPIEDTGSISSTCCKNPLAEE